VYSASVERYLLLILGMLLNQDGSVVKDFGDSSYSIKVPLQTIVIERSHEDPRYFVLYSFLYLGETSYSDSY
jgi:hypothetical protein